MTYSDYGPGCRRNNGFIEGPVLQNQLPADSKCLCGVSTIFYALPRLTMKKNLKLYIIHTITFSL